MKGALFFWSQMKEMVDQCANERGMRPPFTVTSDSRNTNWRMVVRFEEDDPLPDGERCWNIEDLVKPKNDDQCTSPIDVTVADADGEELSWTIELAMPQSH